jgi:hypothetical protein
MKEVLYLLLGWVLGLIGPFIVDSLKSRRRRREISAALRVELEDLQFRLASASFLLLLHHGRLDKGFLNWLYPIVERQAPNDRTLELIKQWSAQDDPNFTRAAQQFRSKEGVGSSLKIYRAQFLETHLGDVANMPIGVQRKIHELRNQLDLLNQEIPKIVDLQKMTYTVSGPNHEIIVEEVNRKYLIVQEASKRTADKAGAVLDDLISSKAVVSASRRWRKPLVLAQATVQRIKTEFLRPFRR